MWRPGKRGVLPDEKTHSHARPAAITRRYAPLQKRSHAELTTAVGLRPAYVASPAPSSHRDRRSTLTLIVALQPSERSTGERVWRGRITKAGNTRARRVLIEGAWTYRFPARMSRLLHERQQGLPRTVREIAWKAQVRLCGRYRRLMAAGKRQTVVTTAVAREMAAFLWAIGREVAPE
jgi:transposase